MEEMGNYIREVRENKKISLEEMHERTKIRVMYLKAIEEGNFSVVPGTVYLKGFLRNIARELDIDYDELLASYPEAIAAYEEEVKVDSYDDSIPTEIITQKKKAKRNRIIIWVVIIAGLLAAGGYYYYYYMMP